MQVPLSNVSEAAGSTHDATMLRTLNTFALDLISIPSVEDLFWYLAQNVVGRLNFVDCVIYQADEEQTMLRQVAAWGEKNPFGRSIVNPLLIPFGLGISGQVAASRKAILVDDLLQDQNYIPDTQPARSEICVPVMFRGRVAGVIDCEHPDPNMFADAELEVLSTVAALAGAKLELLAEAKSSAQRYRDLAVTLDALTKEAEVRKGLEERLFEARRMEAIGKLTGRFAHEFNNLLTVILGNLEFMEAAPAAPEAPKYLNEAKSAAESGARLMRDMLAFAQRTRLAPTVCNLNDLVRGFCAENRGVLTAAVDMHLGDNLWRITADRKAMESILRVLVENAIDANIDQGMITIETRNVTHNLTNNGQFPVGLIPGNYVRLSVIDRGIGIPAERLPLIFDPFFTSKPLGTGLGLSIVQGLTLQSGGAVAVESELGKGTAIHLHFPAST